MEITLLGHPSYKIEGFDGKVDVSPLDIAQMKRLSGSSTVLSIMRKLVKIYRAEGSPLKLPQKLDVEDMDFRDFMQATIGVAAMSNGRQFRRVYKCSNCKVQNPRVIDIIQVFTPEVAPIPGGAASVKVKDATGVEIEVQCRYLRVKDFLAISSMVDALELSVARDDQGNIVNADKLNARFSFLLTVADDDDLQDLADIVHDVGVVAQQIEFPTAKTFEEKLAWLCKLQTDKGDTYKKISETVLSLSPKMQNEYKTECTHCHHEIKDKLEATDYFFAMRLTN